METETNRESIGLRIKELIYELRMNNNSFAVKIGLTAPSVASVVNQKYKPRYEFIKKVLDAFPKVSEKWLMSGEGPMFINDEPQSNKKPKSDNYLMEQLKALEQSWKKDSEEKNQLISQQRFVIETLMSQLNTALGKLDLSKDSLRVVKKPTIILPFANTLANSGTA